MCFRTWFRKSLAEVQGKRFLVVQIDAAALGDRPHCFFFLSPVPHIDFGAERRSTMSGVEELTRSSLKALTRVLEQG